MKKRGQALVEFVIILPILIMLVLGVIDIGNILYSKIVLENQMSDVISLYESQYSVNEIESKLKLDSNKYHLSIDFDHEYITFTLEKKIDIITPGLNFIFDNPYEIETTRSKKNE